MIFPYDDAAELFEPGDIEVEIVEDTDDFPFELENRVVLGSLAHRGVHQSAFYRSSQYYEDSIPKTGFAAFIFNIAGMGRTESEAVKNAVNNYVEQWRSLLWFYLLPYRKAYLEQYVDDDDFELFQGLSDKVIVWGRTGLRCFKHIPKKSFTTHFIIYDNRVLHFGWWTTFKDVREFLQDLTPSEEVLAKFFH